MSTKTRSVFKALAVILVILAVVMELALFEFTGFDFNHFWLAIIGFALLLFVSR